MPVIPPPTHATVTKIFDAIHRKTGQRHRAHLGASQIGRECEREIWYSFRWAKQQDFDGRMLRLFRSGKMAEDQLADDLRATGATVYNSDPDTGEQFQYSDLGGHFAGSMDGAGVGFVESPSKWHVIEYKTHNQKSYDDLTKNGVEKSKPEHYAQVQAYMGWSGMERAAYIALNKNTDEIYVERIKFDQASFDRIRQKAKEIIFATDPPERINDSPAFYKCKMCHFASICHEAGQGQVAEANCRTCKYSAPLEDGGWACDLHRKTLEKDDQLRGCADHQHRAGMAPEAVRRVVKAFGGKVVEQ